MAVSDERTGQNSSPAGIGSTRPPSKGWGSGTSLSVSPPLAVHINACFTLKVQYGQA